MLAGSRWKGVDRTTSMNVVVSFTVSIIPDQVGAPHAHMTSVTTRTISGEAFSPFLLFLGSQNMRAFFFNHSKKAEGKVMIENFPCALPQNFSM